MQDSTDAFGKRSNYEATVRVEANEKLSFSAQSSSSENYAGSRTCQGSGSDTVGGKGEIIDDGEDGQRHEPPRAVQPWQYRILRLSEFDSSYWLLSAEVGLRRDGTWLGVVKAPVSGPRIVGTCTETNPDGSSSTSSGDRIDATYHSLFSGIGNFHGNFRWQSQPQMLSGSSSDSSGEAVFDGYTTTSQWNLTMYCQALAADSAADWTSIFANSSELAKLEPNFRRNVVAFFAALARAGIHPTALVTLRPRERSYLMHWSFRIAKGTPKYPKITPIAVPDYQGPGGFEHVPICWVHRKPDGSVDLPASITAARGMLSSYRIGKYGAAQRSLHNLGRAIDFFVRWNGQPSVHNGPIGPGARAQTRLPAPSATKGSKNLAADQAFINVARSYGLYPVRGDVGHFSDCAHESACLPAD